MVDPKLENRFNLVNDNIVEVTCLMFTRTKYAFISCSFNLGSLFSIYVKV